MVEWSNETAAGGVAQPSDPRTASLLNIPLKEKLSVNSRIFSGVALAGALFMATYGLAAAQTVAPGVPVAPGYPGYPGTPGGPAYPGQVSGHQFNSNHNIGTAANRVGRLIVTLQRDDRDYAGHRVAAINAMTNARNELMAAQQFAEAHGYYTQTTEVPEPVQERPARHDQKRSNYSVANVDGALRRIIGHLQRDTRDYGGHRAAAINLLEQASNDLTAAAQVPETHPNF